MAQTLTVRPSSLLAGPHRQALPLPVNGATFKPARVLGVSTAGYLAGDANAGSVAADSLTLPDVGGNAGTIQPLGTAQLAFVDSTTTSWAVPYPTIAGGIQAGHFALMCLSSQESADPGAPNTPATWTQLFSVGTGAWVPRVTWFWKYMAGGESGTVTVTAPTGQRIHGTMTIYSGVHPSNPWVGTVGHTTGSGTGADPDPTSIDTTGVARAYVIASVAGNDFPNGLDDWDNADIPAGYGLIYQNAANPRFFIHAGRIVETGGVENPAPFTDNRMDNYRATTAALRPSSNAGLTLAVITAVSDTTTTATPAAPTLARSEVQQITNTLTAGTFTLTFNGQTTAAIAFNASAATVQSALEALSNIGAGEAVCTGGPLNLNPVTVSFAGTLANTDLALMTTSTGSVTVAEVRKGHPAATWTHQGNWNIPRFAGTAWGASGAAQLAVWTLNPTSYIVGSKLDVAVSDHGANLSWAAMLLVLDSADPADPVTVISTGLGVLAATFATFDPVTPTVPGSRVLAVLAESAESQYYGPVPPWPSSPPRYATAAQALADRMILSAFLSAPAPAAAETPGSVSWAGAQDWVSGVLALNPAGSAGSLTIPQTLADDSQDTWTDLAFAAGSMFEVVEVDLASLPGDAVITGASVQFAHAADARNPVHVALAGIRADGTFVAAVERQPGGYIADPPGTIVAVDTGSWIEFADGSSITDYSRLGVAMWSTTRDPALTSHLVYSLAVTVTYEPGGPTVPTVTGPGTPGAVLSWTYASGAGLPQLAAQARVVHGSGQDPELVYANPETALEDFGSLGSALVLKTTAWHVETEDVTRTNLGRYRSSQVAVILDGTASAGTALELAATNGAGLDAGNLIAGSARWKLPFLYGQLEVRFKATGDAQGFTWPSVRLMPAENLTRFPAADGGPFPAGGGIDLVADTNRTTLSPTVARLQRLAAGAVAPFDSSDAEALAVNLTGIAGTAWHKLVLTWTPSGVSMDVDDGTLVQVISTDPDWIPDSPMELVVSIELASSATLSTVPKLWIDYVRLRRLVDQVPAVHPLDPAVGDLVADSGRLAGSTRRLWLPDDKPLARGAATAAVRAWAAVPSGVEVESDWRAATFDVTGNPPAPRVPLDEIIHANLGADQVLFMFTGAMPPETVARQDHPEWIEGQRSNFVSGGIDSMGFAFHDAPASDHLWEFRRSALARNGRGVLWGKLKNAHDFTRGLRFFRRKNRASGDLPTEMWCSWRVFLHQEIAYDNTGTVNGVPGQSGFLNFFQWKDRIGATTYATIVMGPERRVGIDPYMSLFVQVQTDGGTFFPTHIPSPRREIPWGEWVHFEARLLSSTAAGTGRLQIWQNNELIVDYTGQTRRTGSESIETSWNLYGQLLVPSDPEVSWDMMAVTTDQTRSFYFATAPTVADQPNSPVFDEATGGVSLQLMTPAGVSRCWLARSADQGLTWDLLGPITVRPSSAVTVTDWAAPLGSTSVRYQASFDAGPMTETSRPVPVGSADIDLTLSAWYWIVEDSPALSTAVFVERYDVSRPRNVVVAEDSERAVVVTSPPLPRRISLTVVAKSKAERLAIDDVLDAGLPVRIVDILGRAYIAQVASDVDERMQRWSPLLAEGTKLRDGHKLSVTFVEVG